MQLFFWHLLWKPNTAPSVNFRMQCGRWLLENWFQLSTLKDRTVTCLNSGSTFYASALQKKMSEVWRHVTMVARFLDLNNLSWQRWSFALSNDKRKVWATVLFLSVIMHRKVIHDSFFVFCFSAIFAGPRNFASMATWRDDFSSLLRTGRSGAAWLAWMCIFVIFKKLKRN